MDGAVPDAVAVNAASRVGVVVIGRNEGERLNVCIRSVKRCVTIIYVDSGSTDGSVQLAREAGVEVVELDMKFAFTAARARNEGFRNLRRLAANLPYVQFVDGDCEIDRSWIEKAATFLDANPDVAVACGRRRERFPSRSIYNRICDIEWNTPIGSVKSCGGDALMRVDALESSGCYRADLIAGEEPELCVRLRAAGWLIHRLDLEMTLHDAAITRFSQWWRRTVRSGYAFAQGASLHGKQPERHWVWESRRALLWGFLLPIACVCCAVIWRPWGLILFSVYPVQLLRRATRASGPLGSRVPLAFFELLSRFPEALGQIKFLRDRLVRRQGRLIEYK
jgi:glycosyltransferase involved in cell wall biosynthesis